jgi:hypothetical protein|nr:AAA family ATPase [Neorhizobium tomejilense]
MALRDWFKLIRGGNGESDSANLDAELERLQTQLEEELLADHVSVVHSRPISYPMPNAATEASGEERASGSLPQVQHLFEYHSVFHRRLWGKTSEMSHFERETVADYLDILANNVGYRGMYLGSRELLEIAAHLREPGLQTSMLVEPWMSPFKLRRRDVRELYIHLCDQALEMLTVEDGTVGARRDWENEVEAAKSTVGQFDLKAFGKLKAAVEAVSLAEHDIKATSLYMNMDYVMACCGDRGAMSRMAGYMDFLVRNDPFVSTRLEDAPEEDDVRRIVGRSWMRLAASVANAGHDPFTAASEWLPNIWLDLRYIDGQGPNTAEQRGLVIPSLGPDVGPYPYARRGWRDDRYGELKGVATSIRPVLSGDDDQSAVKAGIAEAMEVLRSFGVEDAQDENGRREQPASGIAGNHDVMAALASLRGANFGDEASRERSIRIARAIRQEFNTLKAQDLKEGTTAGLIERLVSKSVFDEASPAPVATVKVLDSIGPSEAIRNEGRAEDVYARLLSPLPLVAGVATPDEIYEALQSEFPWMTAANREVAVAVARTERQKAKHWRMQPSLLLGPPGVGKTRWIRRVSELTGAPSHSISLSGVANSKSIIGSERGWASARPSFMALGFMSTFVANPIFHVDELDKTTETNVQDSMLPILEGETARAYPDMYLLGKLDLRWATFLFSANDLAKVSPELVTRLKVLHVRRPSQVEVTKIIPTMVLEAASNENFGRDEIDEVKVNVETKAMKVFIESGDLRDVQRRVDEEIKDFIWKPKGPRLVTS